MDASLSVKRVKSAASGRADLLNSQGLFEKNCWMIVNDAVYSLKNRDKLLGSLSTFSAGLQRFPSSMPTETGTFKDLDYMTLFKALISSGEEQFVQWFNNQLENNYDSLRQKIIDRNIYHIFEWMVRLEIRMDEKTLLTLQEEFDSPDYSARTSLLSRIFNGLQMAIFEVYVLDQLLDQINDD